MQITFDTGMFGPKGEKSLTNVLCYLRRHGCLADGHYPDIERITCRTPSAALRYVRFFAVKGISPESEAVFLKNPTLAVRYLKYVRRAEFADPKVQKRFRRRFRTNARVAYEWAAAFNTRLTEDEETVFRRDMSAAKDYAMQIIRGKFTEKVHAMIMLASFDELPSYQKKCLAEYVRFSER